MGQTLVPNPVEETGEAVASLRGVGKRFGGGRVRALEALDLEVPAGSVTGLLGPNGSGKSTALKILAGLLHPDAGECRVFGGDPMERAVRARIGFVPEGAFFDQRANGRAILRFFGELNGLRGERLAARIEAVSAQTQLAAFLDRPTGTYSKGEGQRLALAQALLHEPDLLLLDEPTTGLDPLATARMADSLQNIRTNGTSIILCSHALAHVERLCDHLVVMAKGRVLFAGGTPALLAGEADWTLECGALDAATRASLSAWLADSGHGTARWVRRLPPLETRFLDFLAQERSRPQDPPPSGSE